MFVNAESAVDSDDPYHLGADEDPIVDDSVEKGESLELTLEEFTGFFHEILNQPSWRAKADKEMDYKDGNQLDSDILQKMASIGMPPAVEPLIGLTIESMLGDEAKRRTDWRVIPDTDKSGQDVADALNQKLNHAERHSRADRSCSEAYEGQISVGIGWVEVSREDDPFKYPYRCNFVHRNEIWWDWLGQHSKSPMLTDARYCIRTKWVDKAVAKLMFPEYADMLEMSIDGWNGFDSYSIDGGHSTGLSIAADQERGWSIEEQEWRDIEHRRIRLFEVWYRRWVNALVLKMPDGRVVELDKTNDMHMLAISQGIEPEYAIISKVRRAWYAGPHKLADDPTPYLHDEFPYVPFWGHKEDRTGVPFGRIRGMMYMQDNINASVSKIRWGLAATVTIRTDGAVLGEDEHFRQEVSRPDADVILDHEHMAKPGSQFRIERNFQLNEQQYKMLNDARASIQKLGGISNEYQGSSNDSKSGVQFNAEVEQSRQSQADLDDNFNESRSHVGQLLLSMIVQDLVDKREDVLIEGGALKDDKVVSLNQPTINEDGIGFLTNDVSRTLLKVTLDEVPSTSSFRTQQLAALSEAYKSSPPDYQRIMMPHIMDLTDTPNKDDIIEAIKNADQQPSPELIESQNATKELEIKELISTAQIEKLEAEKVKILNEAQYSALQTAGTIVQMPATAPIADQVLMNSGYQDPNPQGTDVNFPTPQLPEESPELTELTEEEQLLTQGNQNTSPLSPPVAPAPPGPEQGIETQRVNDNV